LNVRNVFLLAKQTQVHTEETRGVGMEVTQNYTKKPEMPPENLCCQSAQDPCLIVFENCRCSWRSNLKICLLSEYFPIFIAWHQRRNEGGKGARFLGAESLREAKKFQQCHEHFFSKQYICFRKTSGSNMGWQTCFVLQAPSNLVMSIHDAHHDCLAKMAKFVYINTRPLVANYQSQNFWNKMLLIVEVVWP